MRASRHTAYSKQPSPTERTLAGTHTGPSRMREQKQCAPTTSRPSGSTRCFVPRHALSRSTVRTVSGTTSDAGAHGSARTPMRASGRPSTECGSASASSPAPPVAWGGACAAAFPGEGGSARSPLPAQGGGAHGGGRREPTRDRRRGRRPRHRVRARIVEIVPAAVALDRPRPRDAHAAPHERAMRPARPSGTATPRRPTPSSRRARARFRTTRCGAARSRRRTRPPPRARPPREARRGPDTATTGTAASLPHRRTGCRRAPGSSRCRRRPRTRAV